MPRKARRLVWSAEVPAGYDIFLERSIILAVEALVANLFERHPDRQEGFQSPGNRALGTPKLALFPRREGRLV
jgi:hypothetical protein